MPSVNTTFRFSDLIGSYDEFKEFYLEATEDMVVTIDESFIVYTYKVLSRHYASVNVRYDEPASFYLEFANVLVDHIGQYQKDKEIVDSLYKLTLDEMTLVMDTLSNQANNPNTVPDNPYKALNYISNQTISRVDNGKLQSYLQALKGMPSLQVREYLERFGYLFQQMYNEEIYVYKD